MANNKKRASKPRVNTSKDSKQSSVSPEKKAVRSEVKSNMNRRPKWRFKKRDCEHETWGLDITEELLRKLMNFETMTWSQILLKAKKQNHQIKTYTLSKEAQKRLTILKLDDYDEICSLRLDGTHRLYGILDEDGVFSIIWDDLHHEVCPSSKKHT
ncbi:hypothetical protein VNN37_02220 [Lactococcus garvieae]|uniref:hypothetical protein n=1 Tax=Lactococcus garvieae TaxID=1363 RepID=UPI0030D48B2B